jgi:hypothetical protein
MLLVAQFAGATVGNKKTYIHFSGPVQVPGATLPAGHYVLKLLGSHTSRNVVQITNRAEDKVLATFLTISDYRPQATSHTVITFGEASQGQPPAIKAWFYPGETHGLRFIYPKPEAVEIAKTYNEPVPEMPKPVETPPAAKMNVIILALERAPVEAVAPDEQPEKYDAAAFKDDSDSAGMEAENLPTTASQLPFLGILGMLSLLGAALTRRAWKRVG